MSLLPNLALAGAYFLEITSNRKLVDECNFYRDALEKERIQVTALDKKIKEFRDQVHDYEVEKKEFREEIQELKTEIGRLKGELKKQKSTSSIHLPRKNSKSKGVGGLLRD